MSLNVTQGVNISDSAADELGTPETPTWTIAVVCTSFVFVWIFVASVAVVRWRRAQFQAHTRLANLYGPPDFEANVPLSIPLGLTKEAWGVVTGKTTAQDAASPVPDPDAATGSENKGSVV